METGKLYDKIRVTKNGLVYGLPSYSELIILTAVELFIT